MCDVILIMVRLYTTTKEHIREQYKVAVIVSGCWQRTRRVKLYDEREGDEHYMHCVGLFHFYFYDYGTLHT